VGRSILVVDDDPAMLKLVERVLTRAEWRVRSAGNGVEAVGLLAQEPADVVITDLDMPRMNGLALTQHLASHAPKTHVVILTARGSEQSAAECFRVGAADFVRKTDVRKRLLPAVRRLLADDEGPSVTTAPSRRRSGLATLHAGMPCQLSDVQLSILLRQVDRLNKWSELVTASTSIRNRRRHPRRTVCTLIDLVPVHEDGKTAAAERRQGICRDVSEGGCAVVHLRPSFEVSHVAVAMPQPAGPPLTLVARIVRERRVSSDVWELGLEFVQRVETDVHSATNK
jgi:CheY-like chemotaxis protein